MGWAFFCSEEHQLFIDGVNVARLRGLIKKKILYKSVHHLQQRTLCQFSKSTFYQIFEIYQK